MRIRQLALSPLKCLSGLAKTPSKNDTFKLVIASLLNSHIPAGIFTRIVVAIIVKIHAEIHQFTRISAASLNASISVTVRGDVFFCRKVLLQAYEAHTERYSDLVEARCMHDTVSHRTLS